MGKNTKKFLSLVLSVLLVGTSFISANAYTENLSIEVDKIELKYLDPDLNADYVAVSGTLKNDSAEVSNQEIAITKEVFDALVKNSKDRADYTDSQTKVIDEKFDAQQEKLNALNTTEEGTEAYTTAQTEYNTAKAEYDAAEQELDTKVAEYDAKEKELVPSFDSSKWNKLSLTSSTDTENRYKATISGDYPYFVTWVKVTIDGNDYYNYSVNCLEEEVILPVCKVVDGKYYNKDGKEVTEAEYNKSCNPSCKIANGKYYDNNGKEITKAEYEKACGNPKTGINTYYTYGAITVLAAFVLYMTTRKVKKFSK